MGTTHAAQRFGSSNVPAHTVLRSRLADLLIDLLHVDLVLFRHVSIFLAFLSKCTRYSVWVRTVSSSIHSHEGSIGHITFPDNEKANLGMVVTHTGDAFCLKGHYGTDSHCKMSYIDGSEYTGNHVGSEVH